VKEYTIKKTITLVYLLLLSHVTFAVTVEGIHIPEQVTQPGSKQTLKLNGAGVRSKFVFSIYVGALYLPEKKNSVSAILAHTGPNRVSMHFLYDEVAKEKLVNGWQEGFEENNTTAQMEKLRDRLGQFNQLFKTVTKSDVITLDYIPGEGTNVSINNQHQGTIPGHDFNQALLKVWLGEEPADSDLKEAMLGKAKE